VKVGGGVKDGGIVGLSGIVVAEGASIGALVSVGAGPTIFMTPPSTEHPANAAPKKIMRVILSTMDILNGIQERLFRNRFSHLEVFMSHLHSSHIAVDG